MNPDPSQRFGDLLRLHRRAAGLTQEALAARAGLSARAIQELEHGRRHPLLDTLRRLVHALRLSEAAQTEFAASVLSDTGLPPTGSFLVVRAGEFTNVVAPLTSFVGREREVGEVVRLIADVRLLTVTGPPGVGKTRLAQEVASVVWATFPGGVTFVSLAPLRDPRLVLPTIAQMVGVWEVGNQPLAETLRAALRNREALLVLDNFEHVVAAAPEIVELLTTCPRLTALVTSRAALRVRGEQVFPLLPLAVPAPGLPVSATALGAFAAVRLFADRARAASPDFTVSDTEADAVAELCRRLDGLPLAIELAAARSRLQAPGAMLSRLAAPHGAAPPADAGPLLQLLRGGARDMPERQRALGDAIGWSYDLLAPPERALFRRLGVFVGGCTVGAAEAVCDVDSDLGMPVLEGLESLVEESLLQSDGGRAGEPRSTLLETLREYALERLEESGELELTRRRHAAYCLALAEDAEPRLHGEHQAWWLDRLQAEHGNIRAALAWSLTESDAGETVAWLAGALRWFWLRRGHWSEGRGWLEAALARAAPGIATKARAKALDVAGNIAWRQGDHSAARLLCERSVAMWRSLGDRRGLAFALCHLWLVAAEPGDYGLARGMRAESVSLLRELDDAWGLAYVQAPLTLTIILEGDHAAAGAAYAESAALFRELGDRWGLGIALGSLGHIAYLQGDYAAARAWCEESLALKREAGDKWLIAIELERLGHVAIGQRDHHRAAAWYAEGLAMYRELGAKAGVAQGIAGLAWVASTEGEAERAALLLGAADALLGATEHDWYPWALDQRAQSMASARLRLGEARFTSAWATGRAMTAEQAVAAALGEDAADGPQFPAGSLNAAR